MAKLTLRRRPKSRGKSRGKGRGKIRGKSRGKSRGKIRGKSRRGKSRILGHKRKSRIQRGGRMPTKLEIYTALMLELLDEVYLTYKTRYENQYINWVFGTPLNFIKCIKARIVAENSDKISLGQFITTTTSYNDSQFAVSNFKLLDQQQKWIGFIQSLQKTIDNTFGSNIDIASDVLGRNYDLTNQKHITYLRNYIKNLKEGDELGRNALDKALDRMIQWQNDQTTGKPTPSHFLKDIIAQVEGDHPTVAAKINKPTLATNTHTLNFGEVLAITTSFVSDSATLYLTNPDGTKMIVNSDVDKSAEEKQGGLKQIHKKQFTYTCEQLPVGEYTFQLIEHPNEQHKSDPLRIKVVCAAPAEAGAARPAERETTATATARPAPAAEAGAVRPAEIEAARPATATARPAAAAAEARPEAEAGAGAAATAAESKPGWFTSLANRFRSSEKFSNKIKNKIDLLTQKFKILEKTGHSTFESNNDNRIMLQLKKTITGDIDTLVHINNTLNGLLLKYNIR